MAQAINSIQDRAMPTKDGTLIILTGHEGTGKCYWCGGENKRSRHYCCRQCYNSYYDNFFWLWARDKALRRENGKCQKCGEIADQVHHIVPLGKGYRMWNVLNRQDNLEVLCLTHHIVADAQRRWEGKLLAKGQLEWKFPELAEAVSLPNLVDQMGLW